MNKPVLFSKAQPPVQDRLGFFGYGAAFSGVDGAADVIDQFQVFQRVEGRAGLHFVGLPCSGLVQAFHKPAQVGQVLAVEVDAVCVESS